MKYLKLYEKYLTISDIQEDINDYLTYLLDDDSYVVELANEYHGNGVGTINFTFWKKVSVARDIVDWDHVKDYFIPFLYFMKGKYDFKKFDLGIEDLESEVVFDEYIGYTEYEKKVQKKNI